MANRFIVTHIRSITLQVCLCSSLWYFLFTLSLLIICLFSIAITPFLYLCLPLFPLLSLSFFPSLCPPPHSYTLSPLGFGALQWLHHHIGDTTALANEVSLSHYLTHTYTQKHTHMDSQRTHTLYCLSYFIPTFPSLSLSYSLKTYWEQETKLWEWAEQ